MSDVIEALDELTLPPAYVAVRAPGPGDVAGVARAEAARGAGRLVWAAGGGRLVFAVTLEPDEPLATARRAIYAGMAGLAQALAAAAEPERSVGLIWPDAVTYDAARIGGGTLIAPEGCDAAATPDWLVFLAEVIADRDDVGDPGLFPGTSSLAEEALGPGRALIETFASYLMLAFDDWEARGFEALARRYLERMEPGDVRIAPNGDLVVAGVRLALAPALAARGWFDPVRGGVRL